MRTPPKRITISKRDEIKDEQDREAAYGMKMPQMIEDAMNKWINEQMNE